MYVYWRFGAYEFPAIPELANSLTASTFGSPSIEVYSGEADIGDERTSYGMTEVKVTTVVENEATFNSLKSLLGVKDLLYRRRDEDEKYEVILARLTAMSPTKVSSLSSPVKVEMTFSAYIPIWVEFDDLPWFFDTGIFLDNGRYFDECTYLEIDIDHTPIPFTIDNTLSEIDSRGMIVVYPEHGAITGFTLQTYDKRYKFDDTLPSFETLYLDLDRHTIFEGAHSGYPESIIEGWLDIPYGEETYYVLSYDGLVAPGKFYWFYRRQYL